MSQRRSKPSFIQMARLDTKTLRRLTSEPAPVPATTVRDARLEVALAATVLAMPAVSLPDSPPPSSASPPSRAAPSKPRAARGLGMLVAGLVVGLALGRLVIADGPHVPAASTVSATAATVAGPVATIAPATDTVREAPPAIAPPALPASPADDEKPATRARHHRPHDKP